MHSNIMNLGGIMYFCFILEEQYRYDVMPAAVLKQLQEWGHRVDTLEPQSTTTCLTDLLSCHYDALVLKTVSDGPGLSILEAAEAVGIPTINQSLAIRRVRDKAVAAALAHAHGVPTPTTFFITSLSLLNQVPVEQFPLVVKPSHGSSCRDIYYCDSPDDVAHLRIDTRYSGSWLAQHYEENIGFDTKLYVAGTEVYAVAKRSPLHPELDVEKRPIPVTPALRNLALRVGALFGLDIYGLDVVETKRGPVVVDVNDFPSFGLIPEAMTQVAQCILEIAQRSKSQYLPQPELIQRQDKTHLSLIVPQTCA
jgi:ribosomal protein S6--L-glutamate ligase